MNNNRLHLDSVVAPSPDVLSQEVRGDTVLLDLGAEQYYALNEVGSRIWSLIDQRTTVTDICNQLGDRYATERARLEQDVLELLNELLDAGLIVSRDRNHDT
jgi:hypothetical protein